MSKWYNKQEISFRKFYFVTKVKKQCGLEEHDSLIQNIKFSPYTFFNNNTVLSMIYLLN